MRILSARTDLGLLAAALMLLVFPCGCEQAGDPTLDEASELSYAGIYDAPVRLSGGLYEGSPFIEGGASRPTVRLLPGYFVTGELDGGAPMEAAVILSENSGGSGVFIYLAVLGRVDGELADLATVFLGDRVKIRSLSILSGEIRLDSLVHGPDDPACCPSIESLRVWTLDDDVLIEYKGEPGPAEPSPQGLSDDL
jgi:hypothetical protein